MSLKNKEPSRLRKGKEFHKKLQKEWYNNAEGNVKAEKPMTKPSGRKGRMDIFVQDGDDKRLVGIAEIKASNWDAMTLKAVRRNVRRQVRQIWDYIESHLEQGKDVSPGVIFPKRPKDPERMKLIEELFDKEAIQVVWKD